MESKLLDLDDTIAESSEFTILGSYMGLDISKTSTGICICRGGQRKVFNSTIANYSDSKHSEVLMRRELKADILSACDGSVDFDAIIIEDVFSGDNPQTVRILYALNTAIDELILDGLVSCSRFIRISNQTWKSWLFSVDSQQIYSKYNDKIRIEKCLSLLGIHDEGKGYQDRLDATGMIVGYILAGSKALESKKKVVSFGDVEFSYQEDIDLVKQDILLQIQDPIFMYKDCKKATKQWVIDVLTEHPSYVIITKNTLKLGFFGSKLNLPVLEEGYLAVWVREKARKKYIRGDMNEL